MSNWCTKNPKTNVALEYSNNFEKSAVKISNTHITKIVITEDKHIIEISRSAPALS